MRTNPSKPVPLRVVSILVIAALLIAPAARGHDRDDDDHYDRDWTGRHGYDYESLRGWGHWSWVPGFDSLLWFPYVDAGWRPYYHGHWIHTPAGMTWVSHEPWGAIPHHYGRWVWVDRLGWGWVPGWEYSPAWVTWGVVDGYVGWAPSPPVGYRYPRYHRYRPAFWTVRYGYGASFAYHSSGLDFSFWIFVRDRDFYDTDVARCALPPRHSQSFFKWKKVRPVGPTLHVDYVKKVSKREIRTVDTVRKKKRVGGKSIDFWEPQGQREKVRAGREASKRAYPNVREDGRRVAGDKRVVANAPRSAGKTRGVGGKGERREKAGAAPESRVRPAPDRKAEKRSKEATVRDRDQKGEKRSKEATAGKRSTERSSEKKKKKRAR